MYLDYEEEQELIKTFETIANADDSFEEKAEQIKNCIFQYGEKILSNLEIYDYIAEIAKKFMDKYNIDDDYFEDIYRVFCKNEFEYFDVLSFYQGTKLERFSEDDITLTEEDIMLSEECIKNGIEYCAYFIAEQMINREFIKGPISSSMIENILSSYNNSYSGNGDVITPEAISIFIKSLIDILNQKHQNFIFNNDDLDKSYIGVLGFDHFTITTNKKFKSSQPGSSHLVENGYSLDYIDNDYSQTIKEALARAGLEGMFTKAANKKSFRVKDKYFGYDSMNSGHWIPKFDATSKEKLEEYKLSVIAKMTKELSNEAKEQIIMYLLGNNDQEILNQQTTHKR